MAESAELWTLEGVNLADLGVSTIESREGWDIQPGRRGDPVEIPFRHGAYTTPKKYLEAALFSITIVALERLASGAPNPGGIYVGLQTNLDAIKALLYSDTLLDLRRTTADTTVRQAVCEMTAATPWRQRGFTQMEITALFANSEASWRELPQDGDTGLTGTDSLSVGGNAPVGDSVVTATATATGGPYTIKINDTTATIATMTNGDIATIDSGLRRTFIDAGGGLGDVPADATIKLDRANWFELKEASANPIEIDAGITVDVDWYNRWL